ncbi:DUF2268 domain-containing putative Zn-dependent protease [Vibrio lentus]|uniref:DUF2268 domain-containing protein n=1 Tax=Vibrio lentus TaxID=136468 RepID=A0AB36XH91_9VIBR|nr:DUF2268 domain-containing putative Zn-dependent protease [Vibrio lentus]MCC4837300.1 DUF2268 domain-containing protein [Vibrio lentus]MDH5928624.1 DUF2268 domain-containing protein [Vibrio lentus]PMI13897.1 hypothetical protein BCU51_07285 [Vibrio lentus]PMK33853.1 hypothetical protein BCU02_20760 [Vibrio lentus]PMK39684.1 hypothetical protein BCT99_08855 [Vibrio lentus]
MSVNITILDATGKLAKYEKFLMSQLDMAVEVIGSHIEISDLDVTVSPFSNEKVSPFGIGGYALSAHRVEVFLDVSRDDIEDIVENELVAVLGHEINHALRKSHGHKNSTLLDNLVMEGLACHFESVLNNGGVSSMFVDIQDEDWIPIYQRMKPFLESSSFPFEQMFLGTKLDEYPRYAGYWVGYNLVTQYLSRVNTNISDIVALDSSSFVEAI